MNISAIQEIERRAHAEGHAIYANICGQLLDALGALKKLTEKADGFATGLEKAAKDAPDFLEAGYIIVSVDDDNFAELTEAIAQAQEITQ